MPRLSFQKPTDQPTGRNRLLESLRQTFASADLTECHIVVAFAKVGPLLRLRDSIEAWRNAGKAIRAVIGVDEQGTSIEALQFALSHFTETHIAHVLGPFTPTFHPKVYAFRGEAQAVAFVGSNNLTVGGLESNFEVSLRVDMELPADDAIWTAVESCYHDAVTAALPLTSELIDQMTASALVVGEAAMRSLRRRTSRAPGVAVPAPANHPRFPTLAIVPPSSLPAPRQLRPARRRAAGRAAAPPPTAPTIAPATEALVIQILPHHNGEILLSKIAVDQDPAFFGYPFTGLTNPKKAGNRPYPQRVPDPVIDLRIFNAQGRRTKRLFPFNLNTVYYDTKSEIRITVPPDVGAMIPEYSILVMRQSDRCDYEMEVYTPGSAAYHRYLDRCNQTLPSGGRATPRRFGWI